MWLPSKCRRLTPIQKSAVRHTFAGKNTLILAPTGSGKTLAAFLSVLNLLAKGAPEKRVRAVYVSPLKALGRDIARNLEEPLEELNATLPVARRIRMEVRTGDTSLPERARMQRRPPHILLTTPESLSSLLSQAGWRESLRPDCVIVDEIHSLAESKRGTLLALCLERLERRTGALQRIGLSATAHPVEAVARLLAGARPVEIAQADSRKSHRLTIACPEEEVHLPAAGFGPNRIAPAAARLVAQGNSTLIFTTTRSAAEQLGLALDFLLPEVNGAIGVHHGSIDRSERHAVEERLKAGAMRAVVCSSSLELGVDYQAVDQVLLAGTPRGVSRTVQRLGRGGHRLDGVAAGAVLPLSLPDLVEAVALCEAVRNGRLDELRIPRAPLDVLAQALLGMAVEREWTADEAFDLVRGAGPYLGLERGDFDAVLDYLAGGGRVLGGYGTYGKVVVENGRFRVAGRKVARAYYSAIGAISNDVQIRVVAKNRRRLGQVEESFLTSLRPGEGFVIGGQAVKLKALQGGTALVEPATGERLRTPRWMGGRMNLSARLAAEEIRLRRFMREAFTGGGARAVENGLRRDWRVPRDAARRLALYVERQSRACPVPVDRPVSLERIGMGKRTLTIIFHSVAGRAINRSLAWVVGRRFAESHRERPSVVAHFEDHAFLLSVDAKLAPEAERLRAMFDPGGFERDLRLALEETETLGARFRHVAEIGQLLPKRTDARSGAWPGSLLYSTLRRYEPDHPLVREAVREMLEDELDAARAAEQAARIREAPWEVFDLPRPSPMALPLFAFFHREVLMTQDPERALSDYAGRVYDEWSG